MEKKGQMKLSFGMIFSILLIILFIIFAVYGIQKFLTFQKEVKYKTFVDDLQNDVDKMYKSSQGSKQVTYSLPTDTRSICFINPDNGFDNLIFKSKKPRVNESIEHIIISNEVCIRNFDGQVKFLLEKNFGESLVRVSEI